jgi:GMP synthase (glutamine-hydrolysing)
MPDKSQDRVLIVDFGSQVTQLIARRVREAGVYSEIVPYDKAEAVLAEERPAAIILSGGPASVHETGTPQAAPAIFSAGVPVLGICYGEQAMVAALGGQVEGGHSREFGRAELQVIDETPLFEGVFKEGERAQVWMSHGDRVTRLPPGFRTVGISTGAPFAAIADDSRKLYGVQFHPEVVHTPKGAALLRNFVRAIAGCPGEWTMAQFRETEVARIRETVGDAHVVCGLSGGVDSSVAALLIHEAIGEQLTCIFVDHGLLREGEAKEVADLFRGHYNIPLVAVDAAARFLDALQGVTDPETKRKTIGKLFVDVFEAESERIGHVEFLAQGTLYPDVIERIVQGRGEGARARARPAAGFRQPSPVPRPRPRHPHPGRSDRGEARHPAQGRRHLSRRDQEAVAIRQDLAGLRRAAAGAQRRRDGRCAHLRFRLRAPRRHLDRRHDGGLLRFQPRLSRPRGAAHH